MFFTKIVNLNYKEMFQIMYILFQFWCKIFSTLGIYTTKPTSVQYKNIDHQNCSKLLFRALFGRGLWKSQQISISKILFFIIFYRKNVKKNCAENVEYPRRPEKLSKGRSRIVMRMAFLPQNWEIPGKRGRLRKVM